jgi:hypothetical protein
VFIEPERHGFTLTDQYQTQRVDNGFQVNTFVNEIGYTFRPSTTERWYWSLPRTYTGNKIKSYGGRLEFTQRYTQRPQAVYVPDRDIIIIGNGVTIYWSNPQAQIPDVANVSTSLVRCGFDSILEKFAESLCGFEPERQLATSRWQSRT